MIKFLKKITSGLISKIRSGIRNLLPTCLVLHVILSDYDLNNHLTSSTLDFVIFYFYLLTRASVDCKSSLSSRVSPPFFFPSIYFCGS